MDEWIVDKLGTHRSHQANCNLRVKKIYDHFDTGAELG